jgi:hypothetical protein
VLGLLFRIPLLAQTPEFKEAKAKAELGDAEAQFQVAAMYDSGLGVLKSYAESGKWYLKAANQGVAEAQYELGIRYYEYGKNAKGNYTTAFAWFFKAANQGYLPAQYNVAVMYGLGQGVPLDKLEAQKWFNLAAAQGSRRAVAAREDFASQLSREEVAEGERRAARFVPRRLFKPQAVTSVAAAKSSGTGFFITQDGYLITNYHVVEDGTNFQVRTKQGTFPAQVIKTDKSNDLALLKVTGSFAAIAVSTNKQMKLGESVFTIGFPNPAMQGLEPKLTRGDISSLAGMQDDPRYLQISVPLQPGNSGGPLVNSGGHVVGVVTGRLRDMVALQASGALPQNVNYAVKGAFLAAFLEGVPELATKLKPFSAVADRKFEDIVSEVQEAVGIILGY